MSKTVHKVALAIGVAAGATIAVWASGESGKKAVGYISRKSTGLLGKPKLKKEKFDDSEAFYI